MDHLEDNGGSLMKGCLEEFVVTIYGTNRLYEYLSGTLSRLFNQTN